MKNKNKLTEKQKRADDSQWYKDKIRKFGNLSFSSVANTDLYLDMQINFNLYNGIINMDDYEHVCKPFGGKTSTDISNPSEIKNYDIVSKHIKLLEGMEMAQPFSYSVFAVNSEAITRKEETEFNKLKHHVISQIMSPIKQQAEQKYQEEFQGKSLSEEQQQEIQQKIAQEIEASTPQRVKEYMSSEHIDPAERQGQQLLSYLKYSKNLLRVFNKMWKYLLLGHTSVAFIETVGEDIKIRPVNPRRFSYDLSGDSEFIHEGNWASSDFFMSKSELAEFCLDELSDDKIDELFADDYSQSFSYHGEGGEHINSFSERGRVKVSHVTWKDLMKVGILMYKDKEGNVNVEFVSDSYKLNVQAGDLYIEWLWITGLYEGYQVGADLFVKMRHVPRIIDIDQPNHCPLPYVGAVCDNDNTLPLAPMSRIRNYQFEHNIIMYRIESLMNSDKGKLLLHNIASVPKSQGIDLPKWFNYADTMKIMWYNPTEEGNRFTGVNDLAKVLDMSLISDINKYISLAEYIENRAKETLGITREMFGQFQNREAVTNVQQSIVQSSYVLAPYFRLHNYVKQQVLQVLLDTAKAYYAIKNPVKLSYIMDDLTMTYFTTNPDLLLNNTLGVFVADNLAFDNIRKSIVQLAQAALQSGNLDMSYIFYNSPNSCIMFSNHIGNF
jgi:hypothetical protein